MTLVHHTTVRELREALFMVYDQNLTVAELRQILFDIEDQGAVLGFNFDLVAQEKARKYQMERLQVPA